MPAVADERRTRQGVRHTPRRRDLTVTAIEPLSGPLVRVTLRGDLSDFSSVGPDDHIKVFFAGDARDYTPGDCRAAGPADDPELFLDMVVHGTTGPATAWVSQAVPGDHLEIAGPRGSRLAPGGYSRAVLVADASGLPAARRWVHAFAGNTPVTVVLFGDAVGAAAYLEDGLDASAVVESTGDLITDVVALAPDADTYIWGAGEATTLAPLRRHLRQELALTRDNVALQGYWKRGVAGLDHHAPLDPSDPD